MNENLDISNDLKDIVSAIEAAGKTITLAIKGINNVK